jgi:hypothetical protein
MKTLALVLALSLLQVSNSYAGIYNYTCRANAKAYPLRVDEGKKVLEWPGKKYHIVRTTNGEMRMVVPNTVGM